MIRFKNVSKKIHGKEILKSINFKIKKGEFVCITGVSGVGKSTIIHILFGDGKIDKGQVIIENFEVFKLKKSMLQKYRQNIGIVFQDYKLLDSKTIFENVAFPLEVLGFETKEIEKKVFQALKKVSMQDSADKFPKELSGGEKQRIGIARAIIHNPKIIIADEPTGNLDQDSSSKIIKILLDINSEGKTVILATHSLDAVRQAKAREICIKNGIIKNSNKVPNSFF